MRSYRRGEEICHAFQRSQTSARCPSPLTQRAAHNISELPADLRRSIPSGDASTRTSNNVTIIITCLCLHSNFTPEPTGPLEAVCRAQNTSSHCRPRSRGAPSDNSHIREPSADESSHSAQNMWQNVPRCTDRTLCDAPPASENTTDQCENLHATAATLTLRTATA